jgi:hypothetical protein
MQQPESLGSFFKENKTLLKDYIDVRWEIVRLESIRVLSKSMGYLVWLIISLFLGFLIFLFGGLTLGFWLSNLTGSNIKGFGLAALIMIVLLVIIALMRNNLFINPITEKIIAASNEENNIEEEVD